jgi:cell division protein FtsW
LLSMGGTSLIFTGTALGIILSVSRGDHQEEVVAATEGTKVGNRLRTA